jgi:hypothetical protein
MGNQAALPTNIEFFQLHIFNDCYEIGVRSEINKSLSHIYRIRFN